MALKLHRCPNIFVKVKGHPCWKVQKALDDQGIDYEIAKGPWPGRKNRTAVREGLLAQSALDDEDVGIAERLNRTERDQAGVARAATHEGDGAELLLGA